MLDVAHFNHCWRGKESDQDEAFVKELACELGLRFHSARADEIQEDPIRRTEEDARTARYDFLTGVAYETGARYVATAHTASDRAETLLHNLFRGTGLSGAAAPTLTRNLHEELVLVRPLLRCTRNQVEGYLKSLDQEYRTDSSNRNPAYRRNYIREQLMPDIQQRYGEGLESRLVSFCEIVEQANEVFERLAMEYLQDAEVLAKKAIQHGELSRLDATLVAIPHSSLLDAQWPVVRQALKVVWLDRGWPLRSMTRNHWDQIRSILDAPLGSSLNYANLPGDLRLTISGGWIVIHA